MIKNYYWFLIEKLPGVVNIGLWGRSMGAAIYLLYSNCDKRIKSICIYSIFSDIIFFVKESPFFDIIFLFKDIYVIISKINKYYKILIKILIYYENINLEKKNYK